MRGHSDKKFLLSAIFRVLKLNFPDGRRDAKAYLFHFYLSEFQLKLAENTLQRTKLSQMYNENCETRDLKLIIAGRSRPSDICSGQLSYIVSHNL